MKLKQNDVLILGAAGAAAYFILKKAGINLFPKSEYLHPYQVGFVPKDYGVVPAGVSLADYWLEQAARYGTDS